MLFQSQCTQSCLLCLPPTCPLSIFKPNLYSAFQQSASYKMLYNMNKQLQMASDASKLKRRSSLRSQSSFAINNVKPDIKLLARDSKSRRLQQFKKSVIVRSKSFSKKQYQCDAEIARQIKSLIKKCQLETNNKKKPQLKKAKPKRLTQFLLALQNKQIKSLQFSEPLRISVVGQIVNIQTLAKQQTNRERKEKQERQQRQQRQQRHEKQEIQKKQRSETQELMESRENSPINLMKEQSFTIQQPVEKQQREAICRESGSVSNSNNKQTKIQKVQAEIKQNKKLSKQEKSTRINIISLAVKHAIQFKVDPFYNALLYKLFYLLRLKNNREETEKNEKIARGLSSLKAKVKSKKNFEILELNNYDDFFVKAAKPLYDLWVEHYEAKGKQLLWQNYLLHLGCSLLIADDEAEDFLFSHDMYANSLQQLSQSKCIAPVLEDLYSKLNDMFN